MTDDDAGLQHDWDMHDRDSALVRLRGAENCAIEHCRLAHSGGGAIRVDLHGQENKISWNQIEHVGGTGILLCGYGPGTKDVNKNGSSPNSGEASARVAGVERSEPPESYAWGLTTRPSWFDPSHTRKLVKNHKNNLVYNNHIHHAGEIYWHSPG